MTPWLRLLPLLIVTACASPRTTAEKPAAEAIPPAPEVSEEAAAQAPEASAEAKPPAREAPEDPPEAAPGAQAESATLPVIEVGDQVRVKGERLEGRVIDLGEEHLDFDPEYGEGTLKIRYDDIQALLTQREFHVFYSEGGQVTGRLLGVEEGVLLVGDVYERAYRVPLDEIEKGVAREEYDDSLLQRLRVRYRYWNANVDFGFNIEEGAINKRKFDFGIDWQRRKLPTRWIFHFDYRFETQQEAEGPVLQTKDELLGITRFEYELGSRLKLFDRTFAPFAMVGVERDLPRAVKVRTYPSLGMAWRILDRPGYFLQPMFGFSYIYEDFEGFGDNSYPSALLGLEGNFALFWDIELGGWFYYYPGLDNPKNNWLLRWSIAMTVPIYDPIAFKVGFTDVADNNPAPGVGNNKFTTTFGFSLVF